MLSVGVEIVYDDNCRVKRKTKPFCKKKWNRAAIRRKSLPLPLMKWIDSIKPIIHHKKVAMPSPEEMERFAAEGKMVLRTEDLV